MNKFELKDKELTGRIIQEFYETYNKLGFGFDQGVYKNSYSSIMRNWGLEVEFDKEIDVMFGVEKVGTYKLDFVVEQKIILLITSSNEIETHELKRLYNFLKMSPYKTGLLLNFGIKPEHKRRDIL